MSFQGFGAEDFAVFEIPDFEGRMAAIRSRVRPKLIALSGALADALSKQTGLTLFPHVAAHARRKVNPPPDTWLALARSNRGYKRYAHFAVGVQREGAYVRLVLKPEAEDKGRLAAFLREQGQSLLANPSLRDYRWHAPVWPTPKATGDLTRDDLEKLAAHLAGRESSWLAVGVDVPGSDPRLTSVTGVESIARGVVADLLTLYEAASGERAEAKTTASR
ncbi:MAG TPA: DUF1054 family protein [Chloroflexota bacterium]